eukprot:CAMPEP_0113492888 /NCGR_PEP_ID=MMETSP0014_2-20120614/28309_1 /TAXON_ID=2857 /ORGANISM="Nitzschia sp." /LENGTH=258 /DNA_ID=CAMNT_0000386735 /DNA_START=324 /DNA_END=1100 /DNA_ORIENTATION=- /assembly_acc=CAM_ASM_000159
MCKADSPITENNNSNSKKGSSPEPASPASSATNMTKNNSNSNSFEPIVIPDEPRTDLDVSKCIYPKEYDGHFDSLVLTSTEIQNSVKSIAEQIHTDYEGSRPMMLCVLKGATPFYQHLLDAMQDLRHGYETEFIRCSSYEGTDSTGRVKVGGGVEFERLTGKDIIIVEDIVDTGTTLSQLIPTLHEKCQPKSIEVVSLLSKRLDEPPKYVAKYVGFSIPNHFIVGYGLDYNELYRDTKDIFIISQAGIDFDQSTLQSK